MGKHKFGHVIPFQEGVGLETVEPEDLPEVMMSQDCSLLPIQPRPRGNATYSSKNSSASTSAVPTPKSTSHRPHAKRKTAKLPPPLLRSSPWYNLPIGSDNLWKAFWVWDTLCDVLVEQCGTDKPLAAPFFIILVAVAAVLVLTARKLHAALLLP